MDAWTNDGRGWRRKRLSYYTSEREQGGFACRTFFEASQKMRSGPFLKETMMRTKSLFLAVMAACLLPWTTVVVAEISDDELTCSAQSLVVSRADERIRRRDARRTSTTTESQETTTPREAFLEQVP
jgi:hypothetical protein